MTSPDIILLVIVNYHAAIEGGQDPHGPLVYARCRRWQTRTKRHLPQRRIAHVRKTSETLRDINISVPSFP